MQPHSRRRVTTANPALANGEPRLTIQGAGIHQAPRLLPVATLRRCRTLAARLTFRQGDTALFGGFQHRR